MSATAWADLDRIRPGDSATAELEVTADLVAEFARVSGDTNPIHTDPDVARAYAFPRPMAHGMLALTLISRLIGTQLPGPGSIWTAQDLKFLGPVYPGDRMVARVRVQQVSQAARMVVLETEVHNPANGMPILQGTAKVKVPQRIEKEESPEIGSLAALVTGSSRGLGRAIALALAGAGMKVVVHYLAREAEAHAVAQEISAAGGTATVAQADLMAPEDVDRLFAEARSAFGRIDVLINNASPPIRRQPFLDCEWDDFEPFVNAYVRAAFRLVQLAAPEMKSRRFGRIVNVLSSAAVQAPPPQMLPYVTMKSAMAGMSRALAVELGAHNVTVNMVAPSLLITDQNAQIGDRARQLAVAASPLKRLARLEEVAQAVLFLVGEGAGFLTGASLPVAGGEIMP